MNTLALLYDVFDKNKVDGRFDPQPSVKLVGCTSSISPNSVSTSSSSYLANSDPSMQLLNLAVIISAAWLPTYIQHTTCHHWIGSGSTALHYFVRTNRNHVPLPSAFSPTNATLFWDATARAKIIEFIFWPKRIPTRTRSWLQQDKTKISNKIDAHHQKSCCRWIPCLP
jgi:hypothetical protein